MIEKEWTKEGGRHEGDYVRGVGVGDIDVDG
jgi:hypothetical protein